MWINQKRSHFWAPCCNKMITKRKGLWYFNKFSSPILRKFIEISWENFVVDIGALKGLICCIMGVVLCLVLRHLAMAGAAAPAIARVGRVRLLSFDCKMTSIPVCPDDCSLVSVTADNTGAIRVPSAHHHGWTVKKNTIKTGSMEVSG